MNSFDQAVIEFVLRHFSRSFYFFHIVEFMKDDNVFKGGVFAVLVWYLWFKAGTEGLEKRIQILASLISVFFVMAVTLGLAGIFPFRERPFMNAKFNFNSSVTLMGDLTSMSSFPSDHAALFVSMSTGFLFVSRKIGIGAFLYTFIYILFPRVYLGYHYPSDLLAGSLIGASITILFNRSTVINGMISRWIIPLASNFPWYFYSCLFIVTYQIADLFYGSRQILGYIHKLYKHQF